MTGSSRAEHVAGLRPPGRRGAVGVLCLVQFVDVLGVTVVITALPMMLRDLDASPSQGSLIVTGYAMFFGGLLMTGARCGDRYGHRRTIVASCGIFAAASLTGALANSVLVLASARCLQGAAAAAAVPAALRLLTTLTAEGEARRRALAAWSAAGAAAGASGFVVGGVLTEAVGWRAIFWCFIALALGLVPAMVRSVPADARSGDPVPLNPAGSVVLTAAVMALVVGSTVVVEPGRAATGVALLGAAVVAGAGFVAVERRSPHPLIPRVALASANLRDGAAGAFLNTATTASVMTLATIDLQERLGRSPLEAAALLMPLSLTVIVGSALAAPALCRLSARATLAVGLLVIATGNAVLPVSATVVTMPVAFALAGAGLGLASVAANSLATHVDIELRGTASGLVNTTAQLGAALGTAGAILVASVTGPGTAWALAAGVAVLAAAWFARPAGKRSGVDGTGPV
jgi:MFS family permease